jgi:hypothetical protein
MRDSGYFSKLREFLSNERRGRKGSLSKRRRVKRASPFRMEQLEARVLLAGDLASVTLQAAVVQEQYVEGAVNLQNGPGFGISLPGAAGFRDAGRLQCDADGFQVADL